jgi:ABC-type branched-subunit amino acid transport system substrate-binding protein
MKQSVNFKMMILWAAPLLWGACSDDSDSSESVVTTTERICVVMPGSQRELWQRDVDWALKNFKEAQAGMTSQIEIAVEWVDEEAADIESQLQRVAADTTLAAIVGPYSSSVAYTAAVACGTSQKPLILPIATSVELQRIFAGKDYVWNLTQSDISQCEILLTQAVLSLCTDVSLLTSDDQYGQSFSDWFAYQAAELGLNVRYVDIYRSDEDVHSVLNRYAQRPYYSDMLLFAPSTTHAAEVFDAEYAALGIDDDDFPLLMCSDVMNSKELQNKLQRTYEGVAPCANPMSGFNSAYTVRYGEEPTAGEAHLYDAVSLVAYALTAREGKENLNDVIRSVVDGRDTWHAGWLAGDMRQSLLALRSGMHPDLSGVSGDWTFDARTHASVLNTIYAHWILRNGTYTTLDYLSSDGSMRTTSTIQAWESQRSEYQTFNENQTEQNYGPLSGRYAVVVGTSDTWSNYRHQADALAMYQLLKRHGYDDDHIMLIIADNIAYDARNLYPGVVRVRPDGENVYDHVLVDYPLGDLSFADLDSIMLGHASDRLPNVLQTGSQDNVIVFWCGHGNYGHLAWGSDNTVTGEEVADIFRRMKEQGRFRKLLMAVDACYSGSIGEACEDIAGMLSVTAATPYEPSKADMKDLTMGIWLSNAFTRVFQETIDEDPSISIRDLYYYLARATTGSHVTVYNAEAYGNLVHNTMSEFLGD